MAQEKLTRTQVSSAVADLGWRLILGALCTQAATGSLRRGAEAAARLAALDDGSGNLRIDIRNDQLLIAVQVFGPREVAPASIDLARQVSAALGELGLTPEPGQVQTVEIGIDALDIPAVLPFWQAILGYCRAGERDLYDPVWQAPAVWFQQMDAPRPQRNRIHLDITVPHDQARSRIEAALAAGGKIVYDAEAPAFWVLADPEGNEACVCTWQARD
jgi:4a-hydroxytetrahydrobiopterin dehydratase